MGNDRVYVAIDFETSGREKHYACAIGLVKVENNGISDRYYHLIRPPSSNVWFTHIHGLTWNDLKNKPMFPELWDDINAFIKNADFLIAHNARFDRSILYACCEKYDLQKPQAPFIDTLKGARKAICIDSHNLNIVCDYFGIEIKHHDAMEDAFGCAKIFLKLQKLGLTDEEMLL